MKVTFARVFLYIFVLSEIVFIVAPRHGSRVSPQIRRAIETHKDASPQQMEAAIREAEEQEVSGGARTAFIFFAAVAAANGLLVYFFWNHGLSRATAQPPACSG